jgi:ribosomal-protein-alanine N-acetyltransferase
MVAILVSGCAIIPAVVTGAVRVRPLEFDDWPAVHEWAQLLDTCRYQAWGPNTAEQTRAFAREAAAAWRQDPQRRFVFAVLAGDVLVGSAELNLRGNQQAEIGYSIGLEFWGRGLGTAAARELVKLAFGTHGAHRVFATCDSRNVASARVLAKLGMQHEGRMRETILIRDGWRDSDLYAILRHEWAG